MTVHSVDVVYAFTALLCAAIGAAFDLRTRRIPNILTGSSILLGLLMHLLLGGWNQLGWSAAAGVIGGVIFLACSQQLGITGLQRVQAGFDGLVLRMFAGAVSHPAPG